MVKETTSRSSPGVHRVASILNFMADHPGQPFSLTDLVRALKLSRATCHALLTGLVDVGYLYRTNDKSYVLGPALVAIGKTAATHFSPLQVAQPEMRRLADEHDLICSAYFLEGDTIVVRERAASAPHVGYLGPVGTRLKLRPQTAAIFFTRSPEKKIEGWVEAQTPPLADEQRQDLYRGLAFAREHGFVAVVRAAPREGGVQDDVLGTENAQVAVALASEIEAGRSYSIAALIAPVFDAQSKTAFAIGLAGFDGATEGAQVLQIASELTLACERITRFVAGARAPAVPGEPLAA
jgi:DNA-binding IclR family transcriptional regulator